jgi:hypothetical protein
MGDIYLSGQTCVLSTDRERESEINKIREMKGEFRMLGKGSQG